jgi:hypothetical protein
MPKSTEPLTNEQRQLIEENYPAIRKALKTYLACKSMTKSRSTILNEALSYIPDVTLEYNPNIAVKKNFVDFAVQRCIFRLVDQFRSLNRNLRIFKTAKFLTSIKESLKNQNGSYSDEDILKVLEEKKLNAKKILNSKPIRVKTLRAIEQECSKYNKGIATLDVDDHLDGMITKSNKYFSELSGNGMESRNKLVRVRKKLIREYLIPIAKGNKEKSLQQISDEVNLSPGRLSQLMRDDSMKAFIKSFYKDFDSNGIPIPTKKYNV